MADIDFKKHAAQAAKFAESAARSAVIANLDAGAYSRIEDIEVDLKDLAAREPKSE